MSDQVLEAHAVVRAIRLTDILPPQTEQFFDRLEQDPHGYISAALNRLKRINPRILVCETVSAACLAHTGVAFKEISENNATNYYRLAENAREISENLSREKTFNIHTLHAGRERNFVNDLLTCAETGQDLLVVASYFERVGLWWEQNGRGIGINRERNEKSTYILALRHLGKIVKVHGYRLNPRTREAIGWLVGGALNVEFLPSFVHESLRDRGDKKLGNSSRETPNEFPNSYKRL